MAKRKRLVVPSVPRDMPSGAQTPSIQARAAFPSSTPPIASVAGDAAVRSALDQLAGEMQDAMAQGRMVQAVPLDAVDAGHILRDRLVLDDDDMDVLKASIRARGQQTAIEVVALENGGYGLISGYRRLLALKALRAETGDEAFATIKVLVKPIDGASDSYVAMVEENEIRANLSFYERAYLVCEAVRMGVYPDTTSAIQTLFAAATPARRSKIGSFVRLHQGLGDVLRFPVAIPEKVGLRLVRDLIDDKERLRRLKDTLRTNPPADAGRERMVLDRALAGRMPREVEPEPPEIVRGIRLQVAHERVALTGAGVTPQLVRDLEAWLKGHDPAA